MATSNWSSTDNVFENVTVDNYIKMRGIALFTKAVLTARQAETGIAPILAAYSPICDAYVIKYDDWVESEGEHIGSSTTLDTLFDTLSAPNARKWDNAIQDVYDLGTNDYRRLLPHRRGPFQSGNRDERQSAVNALITAIGADLALATLKGQIQAFATSLSNALLLHEGNMGATSILSDEVEAARIVTAQAMFGAFASLCLLNLTNLKNVDSYFDLPNIQHKKQTIFNLHIPAGSFRFIFIHTFKPTDTFEVENNGDANLDFGVSQTRTQPFSGPPFLSVSGHSTSTGTGTQVMNGTYRFFMVVNSSGQDGSFKLTTNF